MFEIKKKENYERIYKYIKLHLSYVIEVVDRREEERKICNQCKRATNALVRIFFLNKFYFYSQETNILEKMTLVTEKDKKGEGGKPNFTYSTLGFISHIHLYLCECL